MIRPGEFQERQAWRGAIVAAGLNAAAMPLDLALARPIPHMPVWPAVASAAVGVLLIVVLAARSRAMTVRFASGAFLVNNFAILSALWVTSGVWATSGARWMPFQANKLGALAAALLAPDLLSGLATIGGYVAMVVLRYDTLAPAVRQGFAIGEPWTIFIYGLFGGALLVYRLQGLRLQQRMLEMHTQSAATERLARTFLAVRDFTNTPLQTIELATEAIRRRHPELAPILDRIDRSVARLFRLNHTFSAYESHLKWTDDEVSLRSDPLLGRSESLTD